MLIMNSSLLLLVVLAGAPVQSPMGVRVADQGERSADERGRVICKKFPETGSLVKTYKICKTKAEWELGRDRVRESMGNNPASCRSANGVCGL
jgi:hypothetical protein